MKRLSSTHLGLALFGLLLFGGVLAADYHEAPNIIPSAKENEDPETRKCTDRLRDEGKSCLAKFEGKGTTCDGFWGILACAAEIICTCDEPAKSKLETEFRGYAKEHYTDIPNCKSPGDFEQSMCGGGKMPGRQNSGESGGDSGGSTGSAILGFILTVAFIGIIAVAIYIGCRKMGKSKSKKSAKKSSSKVSTGGGKSSTSAA